MTDLMMIIPVEGIAIAVIFSALIVVLIAALKSLFSTYEDDK